MSKSYYIYKDLHNFEEEPYIKEHMMLNLISSMWEVKNIVDLEDQEWHRCESAINFHKTSNIPNKGIKCH